MSIKRSDIVDAIKTRLQTITVAAGYHTALGSHITIWLPTSVAVSELPAANIRDVDDSISRGAFPYDEHEMTVEIDIAATGVTNLRSALYDVYKAIGTDPTFNAKAIDTSITGDKFVIDQDERIVVGAIVTISVLFRTSNYQES